MLQGLSLEPRIIELLLSIVFGVTILSTTAWMTAKRLPRKPATRHLVLFSALVSCLSLPLLALVFGVTGLRVLSIPLLSDTTIPSVSTVQSIASQPLADRFAIPINPRSGLPDSADRSSRSESRAPATTAAPAVAPTIAPQPVSSPVETAKRLELRSSSRSSFLRAIATLGLIVWGLGSMFLGLRALASWRLARQLQRASSPLQDLKLLRLAEEAGQALAIRRPLRVLTSRKVMTPLAFGWRRPVIIVPEHLIGLVDDNEMRDVFLHETAHLRRLDPLVVIFEELARALYWPIAPVHALILELGRAREELCDNHVLQGRDALSYGETLLHLAELSCEAPSYFAAVGIVAWKGELERRIAGLLDQGRSTMTRNNRGLVCLIALLFVAGGIVASGTRLSAANRKEQGNSPNEPKIATDEGSDDQEPRGRTILIHTLGPDGRPMPGVEVHRGVWTRQPFKDRNRRAISDDRGEVRFDVPEGIYIYRLWARAKGHVPLFAHWEEEDVPEKSLPKEFTFRLEPGTVIGGIVLNKEGQPIPGVTVEVMLNGGGRGEGRTTPDRWLAEQGPTTHKGNAPITDAQGKWTLDNVPPGGDLDLKLKLSHPDYVSDSNWGDMQDQQGIDLKALRVRKATITMQGGLVATGTVTDPQGKPIAGAVIVRGDNPYAESGSQEVLTDEQGHYQLPPLASGKLTITAIAKGWMPSQTKAEIRQGMAPVDFQLRPGKQLKLRIVDQAESPLPEAWVGIKKWRGGEALYNHKHPNVLDTQIPLSADPQGRFHWTWAPEDGVTYTIEKEGYVRQETTQIADGSEHTITLAKILRITGKVTDTEGQPIKDLTAIPVIEFSPRFQLVDRMHARSWSDGTYTIEADRGDVAHRVRVEAPGYRTAMSKAAVKAGVANPTIHFQLEPAPPIEGRVVDANGQPLNNARVYLATPTQHLNDWPNEDSGGLANNQKVVTDATGRFHFPAQFELTSIVAVHDQGYAEVRLKPDEQPGDLTLKAWASVEGRVVQNGVPVASAWVSFQPIRVRSDVLPHFQDHFSVKTDQKGRFVFPRVPPVKSFVKAQISVWNDGPLKSSRSVPLDLQPGENAVVDLGGQGTQVKGRVVLSGDAKSKIDLHKSLNWLLRRAPGIEPPPDVIATGVNARDGWNNAWTSTSEGAALIDTLQNYFVVLEPDGRFQISGVPAGDYNLALRLYEPPGDGCLVTPVGSKIVRFQVSEEAAKSPAFDLGEIPVNVTIGPRVGELAPDFKAVLSSGDTVTFQSFRGRHVLLDFWATWCGPCVARLPELQRFHDTFGANKKVTVLGLNLDDDRNTASHFLDDRKLPWPQAFLGGQREGDDILIRYAISQIPTYILIGPDGKLLYRGDNLEEITGILAKSLR